MPPIQHHIHDITVLSISQYAAFNSAFGSILFASDWVAKTKGKGLRPAGSLLPT